MDAIMGQYLVALMMALGLSFFCSIRDKTIETNTFLVSFSIAIAVMVWVPLLPFYMIALSIAMLVIVLVKKEGEQI